MDEHWNFCVPYHGSLHDDLLVIRNSGLPGDIRFVAADRLARKWYARPISSGRWDAIKIHFLKSLRKRAKEHGCSADDELHKSVCAGLFIAVDAIDGQPPEKWFHCVRTKLQDEVSFDIMGPGWRSIHRMVEFDPNLYPDACGHRTLNGEEQSIFNLSVKTVKDTTRNTVRYCRMCEEARAWDKKRNRWGQCRNGCSQETARVHDDAKDAGTEFACSNQNAPVSVCLTSDNLIVAAKLSGREIDLLVGRAEGKTCRELSVEFSMTPGAVRVAISRAQKKLKIAKASTYTDVTN